MLAAAVFVKHHLEGAYEAEVDRVAEHEGTGGRFAMLVYLKGEVTVGAASLPADTAAGTRLRYDPAGSRYTVA